MVEILKQSRTWDAIIVGSGATGSIAAYRLCQKGLNVLMLEAGPDRNRSIHQNLNRSHSLKRLFRHFISKRQRIQERHGGYWEADPDLFVDDLDNPFTVPDGKPFRWIRGRQIGGRTLTWGGNLPTVLRL